MKRSIYARRRGSATPKLVRTPDLRTTPKPFRVLGTGKRIVRLPQVVYVAMEDAHSYLLLRALQSLAQRFRIGIDFKAP